jgi:ATP-dependent RNA helicase RhlE
MVKAIERVLSAAIERRTVEDFDYAVPAPKKDGEFARPPRQPAPRRKPAAKSDSRGSAAPGSAAAKAKAPCPARPSAEAHAAGAPPRKRSRGARRRSPAGGN